MLEENFGFHVCFRPLILLMNEEPAGPNQQGFFCRMDIAVVLGVWLLEAALQNISRTGSVIHQRSKNSASHMPPP